VSSNCCRCGFSGDDGAEHPCHGSAYTCRKPATTRFMPKKLATYSLAGVQPKLTGYTTWACDICWEVYMKLLSDI
jgi:hypothetical protein